MVIQGESTNLEPGLIPQCVLTWTLHEQVFASMSKGMDGVKGICIFIELQEVIMIGA